MESFGVDHIKVFLAVVETGSFSAAARALDRAQATVSYTIGNLERALDVELFDRSGHKPALTGAGRALLGHARAVHYESSRLQAAARSFAGGHEPKLSVAMDAATRMAPLVEVLGALGEAFEGVSLEVRVAGRGEVASLVVDGVCAVGVSGPLTEFPEALVQEALGGVAVVAVVSPGHALAKAKGPVAAEVLRQHPHIVQSDSSGLDDGGDRGAVSDRVWRCSDLGAKRALIAGGLGWGTLPRHFIEAELESGLLVPLVPAGWPEQDDYSPRFVIFRREDPPGPAGRWLVERLRGAYA